MTLTTSVDSGVLERARDWPRPPADCRDMRKWKMTKRKGNREARKPKQVKQENPVAATSVAALTGKDTVMSRKR